MIYIKKAFSMFKKTKMDSYPISISLAFFTVVIPFILLVVFKFKNVAFVSLFVTLAIIPAAFGYALFFIDSVRTNGERKTFSYLSHFYEDRKTKTIVTHLLMSLVYVVPLIIMSILIYSRIKSHLPLILSNRLMFSESFSFFELYEYYLTFIFDFIKGIWVPALITIAIVTVIKVKLCLVYFVVADKEKNLYYTDAISESVSLTKKLFPKLLTVEIAFTFVTYFISIFILSPIELYDNMLLFIILILVQLFVMSFINCIYHYAIAFAYEDALSNEEVEYVENKND